MSQLTKNYNAVNEGRMTKSEFLRQMRQSLPGYINQFTSYDDAIRIFKNKGMLTEDVEYVNPGDKFSLEAIQRGIDCELEEMGACTTSPKPEEYFKAKEKAIANLEKDALYYLNRVACCCDKCKKTKAEKEAKSGKDYAQKKTEGEMVKVKPGQAKVHLNEGQEEDTPAPRMTKEKPFTENDKILAQLVPAIMKKTNPETGKNYTQAEARAKAKKMMKAHSAKKECVLAEAVEAGTRDEGDKTFRNLWVKFMSKEYFEKLKAAGKAPEKMLGPVEAANRALAFVRKNMNPKYVPSKEVINSMSDGAHMWKLQMFRNSDGSIKFNQSFGLNEEDDPFTAPEREKEYKEATSLASKIAKDVIAKKPLSKESIEKLKDMPWKAQVAWAKKRVQDAVPADTNFSHIKWTAEEVATQAAAEYLNNYRDQGIMNETTMLQENLGKIVAKVLTEAATANLAKLSDENASIQGVPAVLNNLENIVTEIESFILKEQEKIQTAFDQIGNIKNEDGVSIGYKFVAPIMDSFKADLDPVLAKINLEDIKMPEAPEPDQTELSTGEENLAGPGIDDVASEEVKASIFAPKGAKPNPLAESKQDPVTVANTLKGIASVLGKNTEGKYICLLAPGKILADANDALDNNHEPWRAVAVNKGAKFYLEPFKRYMAESKVRKGRYTTLK